MAKLSAGALKNAVKKGHFIQDRRIEIVLGILLFLVGSLLLYDAYDGRGREAMFPLSTIFPW